MYAVTDKSFDNLGITDLSNDIWFQPFHSTEPNDLFPE